MQPATTPSEPGSSGSDWGGSTRSARPRRTPPSPSQMPLQPVHTDAHREGKEEIGHGWAELVVGGRCEVRVGGGGAKRGVIAYVGPVHFKPGAWAGIKYDEPVGEPLLPPPQGFKLRSRMETGPILSSLRTGLNTSTTEPA